MSKIDEWKSLAEKELRGKPLESIGRSRYKQNANLLNSIERRYGVPGEVIVAIWGLETSFGANTGNKSAIRSLATLADAVDGQRFRVVVANSAAGVTSAPANLKILAQPTARLPNLSVRTTLAAAQNLAVGFVMTGGTKPLLIRAVGPDLSEYGVGAAMPDPRIGFNDPQGT